MSTAAYEAFPWGSNSLTSQSKHAPELSNAQGTSTEGWITVSSYDYICPTATNKKQSAVRLQWVTSRVGFSERLTSVIRIAKCSAPLRRRLNLSFRLGNNPPIFLPPARRPGLLWECRVGKPGRERFRPIIAPKCFYDAALGRTTIFINAAVFLTSLSRF